jgi:hypothetical protein
MSIWSGLLSADTVYVVCAYSSGRDYSLCFEFLAYVGLLWFTQATRDEDCKRLILNYSGCQPPEVCSIDQFRYAVGSDCIRSFVQSDDPYSRTLCSTQAGGHALCHCRFAPCSIRLPPCPRLRSALSESMRLLASMYDMPALCSHGRPGRSGLLQVFPAQ